MKDREAPSSTHCVSGEHLWWRNHLDYSRLAEVTSAAPASVHEHLTISGTIDCKHCLDEITRATYGRHRRSNTRARGKNDRVKRAQCHCCQWYESLVRATN